MKSAALLCFAVFAAAATAQQPAQNQNETLSQQAAQVQRAQKALSTLIARANRCAIGMSARQGGGLRYLTTNKNGNTSSQPEMNPSLTLHNPTGKRILSAAITAIGYGAPKGAMTLEAKKSTAPGAPSRPSLTRTLTVKFQPDDNNTVSGDFRLAGFVQLETIELNSVTYDDGSIQSFDTSICRVTPDPLMLVSTH
jgi:hypothetical protein